MLENTFDRRKDVSKFQQRSHSADLFSARSTVMPTSDDNRWKRASSENRDPEILSKSAWFIKESDAVSAEGVAYVVRGGKPPL